MTNGQMTKRCQSQFRQVGSVVMDNLGYLFAAYLVFWLISFVFILGIAVRQKRLEREIDRLKRAQENKETEEPEQQKLQRKHRRLLS